MKNKIIIILLLVCITNVSLVAQQTKNYVKTYTSRAELKSNISTNSSEKFVLQQIQYVDGIGRPTQNVIKRGSTNHKDMVYITTYDSFSRVDKSYLPFQSYLNSGAYNENGTAAQKSFYNNHFGGDAGDYAYSKAAYDDSPLNRIIEQGAPGKAWRLGGGHTAEFVYRTNKSNDLIRILKLSVDDFIEIGGDYEQGELNVVETTDENNANNEGETIEFTDKKGRLLVKKVLENHSPLKYASTYYVYDYFNRLRYVIPPAAVRIIEENQNDWTKIQEDSFQNQWMFCYQYDGRGRMIAKRIPGAEWMYMIYDNRDRLILSQDGNQRVHQKEVINGDVIKDAYQGDSYELTAGSSLLLAPGFEFIPVGNDCFNATFDAIDEISEWSFVKYDELNRPVLNGVYQTNQTIEELRNAASNVTIFGTVYTGSGSLQGYDNVGFPQVAASDLQSVTYYDDYAFANHMTFTGALNVVKGQVTGTRVKVFGQDKWLTTITHYDERYRPIRLSTENHLNGFDILVNKYRNLVSPLIEESVMTHTSDQLNNPLTVKETYAYDHMDRLMKHTHQINEEEIVDLVITGYNTIGELSLKEIGNGVQMIDYAYNIRGWLTKINGGAETIGQAGNLDQFGMELLYDQASQYNGNIGEMKWKSLGGTGVNSQEQSYIYTYDPMNRLKKATYASHNLANYFDVGGNDNGGIKYDANGNILSLNRYKKLNHDGSKRLIDQLIYSYASGNQLSEVTDQGSDFTYTSNGEQVKVKDDGFKDGNILGEDYLYDANGNMVVDKNKKIKNITYNLLNLPELVTFENDDYVSYLYDASGVKLQKKTKLGENINVTDYVTGKHYQDGELTFFQHNEGRVVKNGNSFRYEYNLTDHLGNVRVTVTPEDPTRNSAYDVTLDEMMTVVDQDKEQFTISHDLISVSTSTIYFWSAYGAEQNASGLIIGDDAKLSLTSSVSVSGEGTWYLIRREVNTSPVVDFDSGKKSSQYGGFVDLDGFEYILEGQFTIFKTPPPALVVQRDDYYPFGLTFNNYKDNAPENTYLYSQGVGDVKFAVERQVELDVDFTKRRAYDYTTGRFWQVDPLADAMPQESLSPYHYSFNNPVRYNDPYGEMGWPVNGEGIARTIRSKLHQANEALNELGDDIADFFTIADENKIKVEKQPKISDNEKVDSGIEDGIITVKNGDQPNNAPKGKGHIVEEPSSSPLGFKSPSKSSRTSLLFDTFVKPFIKFVNPIEHIPGDSAVIRVPGVHPNTGEYGLVPTIMVRMNNGNLSPVGGRPVENKQDSIKYGVK